MAKRGKKGQKRTARRLAAMQMPPATPTPAPSQEGLVPNLSLNSQKWLRQHTEDEGLLQRRELRSPDGFDFTSSDPWRVLRISSEFVQGIDALAHISRAVAVFGSARSAPGTPNYEAATTLAR